MKQVNELTSDEVLTHELTHDGQTNECPMCVRPANVCEPCEVVVTDYGDYTTSEVMEIVRDYGPELPDHMCEDTECMCSCPNKPSTKVLACGQLEVKQVREPNTAYLFELPDCDICATTGETVKAAYDGSMVRTGSWAFMCESHFQKYGVGLGVGRGQKLALRLDID